MTLQNKSIEIFVSKLFFSKTVWKCSYNYITLHQTFDTLQNRNIKEHYYGTKKK
nr:MAG TPA: hypothetical protein [Caudoviricetes sp.]